MRETARKILSAVFRWISPPPPDQSSTVKYLSHALSEMVARESSPHARYMERVAELMEARQMCGSGPWTVGPAALASTDRILTEAAHRINARESQPPGVAGAYADIELALSNVEWRREVNLSSLEFSRWGIQQIILVARLHYIKNPIIRRLIDVCASYIFSRGVSVSSGDEAANEVIQDFLARNKGTLGQNALTDLERRKDYDGNLFFVLFTDTQSTGRVNCRTIDATEIVEIVTDPEDADTPRFYKRQWMQKTLDILTGQSKEESAQLWYPALGYEPADQIQTLGGIQVKWDSPVLHRKCGGVAKWHFGCPRIYPAIDWAKESRKYLESCASVAQSLAQIALIFTTKGGQQALAGVKDQIGTTVNAGGSSLWDTNPPAASGSTFASGPGTQLSAFKTQGAGLDPESVRQYKLMCCMVAGVPETFLGDVSTGNLATAASLDRPTETVFLEKQESWREDLVALCSYAVRSSLLAPGGKLRESRKSDVAIREAARVVLPNGRRVYEKAKVLKDVIEIRAEFPAIREGDLAALVAATVESMTLGTQSVCGIDEKEGVRKLYDLLGIEGGEELVEQQYPEASYDPERDMEPEPESAPAPAPGIPGTPANPKKQAEAERIEGAMRRLGKALKVYEANRGTHAH